MALRSGMILLSLLICTSVLHGQDNATEPLLFPGGISLQYGIASFALVDEYISPERYTGLLPGYALEWNRSHENYVYALGFEFGQSDDFSNNHVTSEVLKFRLSQGFLYCLKPVKLFQKELGLWIGPGTDIFYFENSPDIAVSGFDYSHSFATLVSLGFRGDAIYPFSERFSLESSLQFTLLSLGIRTIDKEEEEDSAAKLLSTLSGLNASFFLGMNVELTGWLSLGLAYRFTITRVSAWDEILMAGNSVCATLQFRF